MSDARGDQPAPKELEILKVMRRVLTQVVREITPGPGLRHPLSAGTIEDVRQCLALISARERELSAESGQPERRPRYADEGRKVRILSRRPGDADKESGS